MGVDTRRELSYIWEQLDGYQNTIGEEVVWFRFDTVNSRWDEVYAEGDLKYHPGVRVPVLWVDQIEDPEQYSAEGRRPQQRLRFAASVQKLQQRGIPTTEAHGNTLGTADVTQALGLQPGRPRTPWRDDLNNDIVYYDRRFYAISNYQIRGRAKFADTIVGVSALEFRPDDEAFLSEFPFNTPYGSGQMTPTNGGVPLVGVLSTPLGFPIVAITGAPTRWQFKFDADLVDSTWNFVVRGDDGVLINQGATQLDLHTVEVEVTQAQLDDTLGEGEFKWALHQLYNDKTWPVMQGPFYITDDAANVPTLDIEGDNDPEKTLLAQKGADSSWTFQYGEDLTGSTWTAEFFDPAGTKVGDFVVDTSGQAAGSVVLRLLVDTLTPLSSSTVYTWTLTQHFGAEDPNPVDSGLLSVLEA